MSDGAGEVVAVGEGVAEFAVGDHVMSMFFPDWLLDDATPFTQAKMPGDTIDGYAREYVTVLAAVAWTPRLFPCRAATLPCAHDLGAGW